MRHETDDVRVLLELVDGFDLMILRARRNYELDVKRSLGGDDLVYRLLGEDQPKHRAIFSLFAVLRVMHLKDQLRARFDQLGLSGLGHKWSLPRREGSENAVSDVELARLAGLLAHLTGVPRVHHDMMDN